MGVCISHPLAPRVQACADNPRILKSVHPALLACSHEIYSPTFSAVTHKARIHHHAPSRWRRLYDHGDLEPILVMITLAELPMRGLIMIHHR